MEIFLAIVFILATIAIIFYSTRYKIRFWFGSKEEREFKKELTKYDKWKKRGFR